MRVFILCYYGTVPHNALFVRSKKNKLCITSTLPKIKHIVESPPVDAYLSLSPDTPQPIAYTSLGSTRYNCHWSLHLALEGSTGSAVEQCSEAPAPLFLVLLCVVPTKLLAHTMNAYSGTFCYLSCRRLRARA